MAKATFTNEDLCVAWAKQAKADPKGTRGDVVKDLLAQMDVACTDETFRKAYNNVTQRKKQLESHDTKPVTFPNLEPGKKGARRTDAAMDALQAIFEDDADAENDPDDDNES